MEERQESLVSVIDFLLRKHDATEQTIKENKKMFSKA